MYIYLFYVNIMIAHCKVPGDRLMLCSVNILRLFDTEQTYILLILITKASKRVSTFKALIGNHTTVTRSLAFPSTADHIDHRTMTHQQGPKLARVIPSVIQNFPSLTLTHPQHLTVCSASSDLLQDLH